MIAAVDPMAALKPLHLPPGPAFWPPAPGWWIVALFGLALLAAAIYLYRRRDSLYRTAQQELAAIRTEFERIGDGGHALRQVSRLLKRVALSTDRRERVALLSGEAWLAYLSERSGTPFLDAEKTAAFCRGLYQVSGPDTEDLDWLFEAAGRWIDRVLK